MTYREEMQRRVLTHLLDRYPPGFKITEKHWEAAYTLIRTDCLINTIQWKLDNMDVTCR